MQTADVALDFTHVESAIAALEAGSERQALDLTRLPVMEHISKHLRRWTSLPPLSSEDIVRGMLFPLEERSALVPEVRAALRHAKQMACDQTWKREVLRFLPQNHQFQRATIYFTFGYGLGVASGPRAASVNLAHERCRRHPGSVKFYAMHELHHMGYLAHHEAPSVGSISTRERLLGLVRLLVHSEGLAMYAPYRLREEGGALGHDPDYLAMQDEHYLTVLESRFWRLHRGITALPSRLGPGQVAKVIGAFGRWGKLLHLVGFHWVRRIDDLMGRGALTQTIIDGPGSFFALARAVSAAKR